MEPERDPNLVRSVGTDPRAFEDFYRTHVVQVVAFATRRCRTPEEVADLVATTFVAAIESAHRYDPGRGEPGAWLLGIAANVLAGRRRRDGRERAAVERLSGRRLLDTDDYARLDEMIDAARIAPHVEDAIAELPAAQQVIVHLVRDGVSPTDAARRLRISPATARMRLSRARRTLRHSLAGRLEPADLRLPEEER